MNDPTKLRLDTDTSWLTNNSHWIALFILLLLAITIYMCYPRIARLRERLNK